MFLKDEPGIFTSKRQTTAIPRHTPFTPASMAIQRSNPFDEAKLAQMREAQRRALATIQKTSSPSTTANTGYMGSANAVEHRMEMAKEAAAAASANPTGVDPSGGALQDLVDQGILSEEDAAARAAAMFAPQLAYLDTLSSQAKGRATDADKKIAAMYAAQQAGYVADRPVVEALYNKQNKDVGAAYDEGVKANNAQQQGVAERTAQMIKSLGLTPGEGFFSQNVADTQAANKRMIENKATEAAGTVKQRTAGVADLVAKGQAAGLMSADQRWALQMKLQDILGGYGMKKAELKGMEASAAQDILNRSSQSQSDAVKALMQQQQQAFENDLSMKKYGLEERKFAADQAGGGGSKSGEKLSPIQEISAAAADAYQAFGQKTYGHAVGPEEAANGVKAITDAASMWASDPQHKKEGRPQPKTAQEFMDYVRKINPKAKDIAILRDLAQRYFRAAWG